MGGAMDAAVCFNICAEIPSGPFDLLMSRDSSSSHMFSSLHKSSDGKLSESGTSGRMSFDSGGTEQLKHSENMYLVGLPFQDQCWLRMNLLRG